MDSEQSNRQRRLIEAMNDLPAPWETTRERSESEAIGRHVTALRYRLDKLVEQEHRFGDEQKNLHGNRAERNALIWSLSEHAGIAAKASVSTPKPRRQAVEYATEQLAIAEELLQQGFCRVDPTRPGFAMHKHGDDIVPKQVTLLVWGYLLGRAG